MAVNVTVVLSDSEAAAIRELADRIQPGMTDPQLIAWAAVQSKKGLRVEFMKLWYAAEANLEQTTKLTRQANINTNFPEVP